MSDDKKEMISAMLDGEAGSDTASAMNSLLHTPALQGSWARYALISDSLKQHLPAYIDTGLAARIAATIAGEPFVLAPIQPRSRRPAYLRPVAGFAIAASVATMAIIGIQGKQKDLPAATTHQVVAFAPQEAQNPVAVQTVSNVAAVDDAQARQLQADSRARLNSYLVNYNEHRTHAGFQGMLPYARTVTFENKQ